MSKKNRKSPPIEPEWQRATKGAQERLQILLKTGVFHDVLLGVEEGKCTEIFTAHMLILAMTSPVFEDDFYDENIPKGWHGNPVFRSLGRRFTIRAVEAMLRYAYSCPGRVSFECPVEAMETYRVAKAYKMDHLQEVCSKYLQAAELSPENTVLIYGDELHTEILGLREKCFDVLEAKPLLVMRIAAERAKCSTIKDFLKRENMVIPSELHLLKYIIEGAKYRIFLGERRDEDLKNFLLTTIFPSIRFLTMSDLQFSEACEICGPAITDSEGFSIFKKLRQPFEFNDDKNLSPWLNRRTEHRMGRPEVYDIPIRNPDSSPPETPSTNNFMFKLEIKAKERHHFVFTGIELLYRPYHNQPVRGILNATNETQKIDFRQKYSEQDGGKDKRLQFTEPLTVLQDETAQLILDLDNKMALGFYKSQKNPNNIGFEVNDYDQPIAIWKLWYRRLYL